MMPGATRPGKCDGGNTDWARKPQVFEGSLRALHAAQYGLAHLAGERDRSNWAGAPMRLVPRAIV